MMPRWSLSKPKLKYFNKTWQQERNAGNVDTTRATQSPRRDDEIETSIHTHEKETTLDEKKRTRTSNSNNNSSSVM
jgi:hypothetical protein